MKSIYLDNSATTEVNEDVAKYIYITMIAFTGNPSSLYDMGVEAKLKLNYAAKQVAELVGATDEEIYFTSGGTESNNWAVFGTAMAKKKRGNRIVTTAFEHASVLEPMKRLEQEGFEIVRVAPNKNGVITAEDILSQVNDRTILVSFMMVNNEIGTVLPYEEIAKKVKKLAPNATVHCDAVQALGKLPIKLSKTQIDLMSMSGHKIYAPKGIGALYIKKGTRIDPLILGGTQQRGLRPGTESLPLASGMGRAAELRKKTLKADYEKICSLHDYLLEKLSAIEGVTINSPENALPYIINISIYGIRSETMLHYLEAEKIYVSSASACTGGAASHVLSSMGLPRGMIDSAIRISLCPDINIEDLDRFITVLKSGIRAIARGR